MRLYLVADAAAAVGGFEVLGADLDGHAAGDFAHGGEEREGAVGLADGFVGALGVVPKPV